MDRTLLFGAAVLLFCVRDGRLAGSRPITSAAALPILLAASAGCGLVAERISADEATAWLTDVRFWLPSVVLHALLAFHAARLGRMNRQVHWISLLPAPVWLVTTTGGARAALTWIDGVTGVAVGLALGAAYSAAAGSLALWGRFDRAPQAALRFASATHISAILLVPAATVLDRPLSSQRVDWFVTAIVIGSVALILGLSFAWHRFREP